MKLSGIGFLIKLQGPEVGLHDVPTSSGLQVGLDFLNVLHDVDVVVLEFVVWCTRQGGCARFAMPRVFALAHITEVRAMPRLSEQSRAEQHRAEQSIAMQDRAEQSKGVHVCACMCVHLCECMCVCTHACACVSVCACV